MRESEKKNQFSSFIYSSIFFSFFLSFFLQALENEELRYAEISKSLDLLPPGNKVCLNLLLELLNHVHEHSDKNKMPSSSLAIIIGPCMLRDKNAKDHTGGVGLAVSQKDIK